MKPHGFRMRSSRSSQLWCDRLPGRPEHVKPIKGHLCAEDLHVPAHLVERPVWQMELASSVSTRPFIISPANVKPAAHQFVFFHAHPARLVLHASNWGGASFCEPGIERNRAGSGKRRERVGRR